MLKWTENCKASRKVELQQKNIKAVLNWKVSRYINIQKSIDKIMSDKHFIPRLMGINKPKQDELYMYQNPPLRSY